jgi:capsular polysaccharide transport system ATP-binding protein
MILCENVTKSYPMGSGRKKVLQGIDMQIRPGEHLGFLGRNGAGKTTLIKLIGGVEMPTSGKIKRNMSVSWPLGFGGAIHCPNLRS